MLIDYDKLPRKGRTNAIYINKLALEKGYKLYQLDYYTGMLRYKKEGVSINVYCTTLTVTTEIKHPKKGKTQLHRKLGKFIDKRKLNLIGQLFDNPRTHTGKGYYKTNN